MISGDNEIKKARADGLLVTSKVSIGVQSISPSAYDSV